MNDGAKIPFAGAHPDFTSAGAPHRYSGVLAELFPLLDRECQARPHTIRWRVLRSGAVVSMSRSPDGLRVLRIARREKPKTADGPAKWDAELATFLRHFGIEHWPRSDDPNAIGVAAEFYELRASGVDDE